MNAAVLKSPVELFPMAERDLDDVLRIEYRVYSHPWSRANFVDSINSGYCCRVCCQGGDLVGYFVLMMVVDEAHLLNISVAEKYQGMGFGACLLRHAMTNAQQARATTLLLEVRPSNDKALSLYRHYGFQQISVRRDYYPAATGREDALVLMCPLEEEIRI